MQHKHQSINGVDDVFRRISFGENAKGEPVASAFVALGLILNYLNLKNGNRVIPDIYEAEALQGSRWDPTKYPRTNQFKKLLKRLFGAEPKQSDLWGKQFSDKFNQGWLGLYWVAKIFVRCTFGGVGKDKTWQLVVDEIENNRPAMVIMRSVVVNDKQLRFYAMATCGYRTNALGKRELMVHSGQYGEQNVRGSRAQTLYVPIEQVICGYRFNVLLKGMSKDELQDF
jgi:hypothetical protein